MSNRIASIEQCCNPLKLLHNLHTGRGGVLRQRSLNAECKHLHITVLTDVFLSPCSNILHTIMCFESAEPRVILGFEREIFEKLSRSQANMKPSSVTN